MDPRLKELQKQVEEDHWQWKNDKWFDAWKAQVEQERKRERERERKRKLDELLKAYKARQNRRIWNQDREDWFSDFRQGKRPRRYLPFPSQTDDVSGMGFIKPIIKSLGYWLKYGKSWKADSDKQKAELERLRKKKGGKKIKRKTRR